MEILNFIQALNIDLGAIAAHFGVWGAFGYLTLCKAAAIFCNNTKTKDTAFYRIAEWFASNDKQAKL